MEKMFIAIFSMFLCLSCGGHGEKKSAYYKKNKTDIAYQISREYAEIPIKANIASQLTLAFQEMAKGSNPFFASTDMETFVREATMGTLIYQHPASGKFVGSLAESVIVSPDFSNVVFTLGKNRKFADGSEITIADVEADFRFLKEIMYGTKVYAQFFIPGNQINIDSTTDTQITLSFSLMDPNVLERLSHFPVIKKEEIQRITDYNALGESLRFTSSGPYMVKEETTGSIILEANPYYHRGDSLGNRYPYTDSLILKYASDREELIRDFLSGNVDLFKSTDGEFELLSTVMQRMDGQKRVIDTGYRNSRIITAYNSFHAKSASYMKHSGVRRFLAGIFGGLTSEIPELNALSYARDEDAFLPPPVPKQLFTDDNGKLGFENQPMKLKIVIFAGDFSERLESAIKQTLDLNGVTYEIRRPENTGDFIDTVFYSQDYDVVFFEYQVFPETSRWKNLFTSPFFDTVLSAPGSKRALTENWQFTPVFAQKEYFFADYRIHNFYFQPNYGSFCDLLTLETMCKTVVIPE